MELFYITWMEVHYVKYKDSIMLPEIHYVSLMEWHYVKGVLIYCYMLKIT